MKRGFYDRQRCANCWKKTFWY